MEAVFCLFGEFKLEQEAFYRQKWLQPGPGGGREEEKKSSGNMMQGMARATMISERLESMNRLSGRPAGCVCREQDCGEHDLASPPPRLRSRTSALPAYSLMNFLVQLSLMQRLELVAAHAKNQ